DVDPPAEHGGEFVPEVSIINRRVRPSPEPGIGAPMEAQQMRGFCWVAPDPARKCLCTHSVLNAEGTRLEQLTNGAMGGLGTIGRNSPSLLGEREVGITRRVRREHRRIARERCCDPELLL